MYLAVLKNEEKDLFLGLAYGLATLDRDYSDAERATIAGYCQEMQIIFDERKMLKPLEEILRRMNEIFDDKTKKIVVFEAVGLAMADNNYDDNERKVVARMESMFKLEPGFSMKCESVLNEYISFQDRLNQLILG